VRETRCDTVQAVLPESNPTTRRTARRLLGASPVRRALLGLTLSASLLLQAGTGLAQTDEEKAAARALATQGADALKQNHYAEALDLVSRAQAIVHAPTHLLMIARADVGLGKLVAAQEAYLKLIHEELAATAPAAFKNAQAVAKDELAAIEPKIGSLRIDVEGIGQKKVTVKLDEQMVPPALLGVFRPVDPGPHVISVFPVGQSPVKGTVDVHEAEKKEIKLTIPDAPASGVPLSAGDNPDVAKPVEAPQPPGRDTTTTSSGFMTPLRGAGIGVGAVGVAGVVVGSLFMAKGFSSQSAANAAAVAAGCTNGGLTCPNTPKVAAAKATINADDKDAANQKTIGAIGLAVGGAALVTGVVLIVIGKPKPAAAAAAPPPRASVTPWFSGTAGGLRGEF
jgi:hypothetical protein